jgi:gamma-carbonic anhydrase
LLLRFNGSQPTVASSAFIAPNATLIGMVTIQEEASIWFQTVVRGDINHISIGSQTNIQDSCVLHVTYKHPVILGKRITVGHGAILHGCNIADDCLIAMGAIVLDGAVIEEKCLIGAGTLVPPGMVVPQGSLVLGSPAKIIRQLNDADLDKIERGWRNYVQYSKQYKDEIG